MITDLMVLIEKKKADFSQFKTILNDSIIHLTELQELIHPFIVISHKLNSNLVKSSSLEEIRLPQNILIFEENIQFAITKNHILLNTLNSVFNQLEETQETVKKEIPIFMMTKEVNSILEGLSQLSSNLK